jgi:hypothetical protein
MKVVAGLVVLMGLAQGSFASIYSFGPTNDWYATGMTAANSGNQLVTKTSITNSICGWGMPSGTGGTWYPTLPTGAWAGAKWTAPAGEVITQISISGYYRNDGDKMQAEVYGGTSTGSAGNIQLWNSIDAGATVSGARKVFSNSIITLNPVTGVTQVQFRPYMCRASEVIAAGVAGYDGFMNAIQITTAPVPEPSLCLLMIMGGLGIMQRRHMK